MDGKDHRGQPAKCGSCFAEVPPQGRFLRCGACKKAYYCNITCQRSAWVFHKPNCGRPKMRQSAFADRYEWRGHFGPHVGKEDFEVRFQAGELVVLGATDPTLVEDVLAFPEDALRSTLNATFKEQTLVISASRLPAPAASAPAASTGAPAASTGAPSSPSRPSPPKTPAATAHAPAAEGARPPTAKPKKPVVQSHSAPQATGPVVQKITNYAFADDGAVVKVYVPWPGAHTLAAEQVTVQVGDDGGRLECRITTGPETASCLSLLLYDRVSTAATVKIRSDKLILTLTKTIPRSWLTLTRKPWEFLASPAPEPCAGPGMMTRGSRIGSDRARGSAPVMRKG